MQRGARTCTKGREFQVTLALSAARKRPLMAGMWSKRRGFKIPRWQHLEGSSPSSGTTNKWPCAATRAPQGASLRSWGSRHSDPFVRELDTRDVDGRARAKRAGLAAGSTRSVRAHPPAGSQATSPSPTFPAPRFPYAQTPHCRARFLVRRSSRAAVRAAASRSGRSSPRPKYISSGVCPWNAEWGMEVLCSST